MPGLDIERIEALLLIAAIVAMLARRLHLPYTVGLVLAGGAVALSPISLAVPLTKDLIFTAFLPPLVFDAALHIPVSELRRDYPVIATLATLGVLVSAAIVAVGLHLAAGWPWVSASLFGVLISATDPVSVIAILRDVGARGRLRLLTEAESLFNDGTAAAAFAIVLAAAQSGAIRAPSVVASFVVVVLGGAVCGAAVAAIVLLLAGRTTDHLVEITFTTIAAYGSFLLAEHLHVSGVLAALTAGLLVGNLGRLGPISEQGREAVESFWEYAVFVVNSLVFLLIGMSEARLGLPEVWRPVLLAIGLVILARAASVYGSCALFARSRHRILPRHQHALFWGGLRGALALALALGLPADLPYRSEAVTVAFAVVAFSIIVQGLTMTPLLRRLGELSPLAASREARREG